MASSQAGRSTAGTPIDKRLLKRRQITESGCWEWTGARTERGYGVMSVAGDAGGMRRVHRLAHELWIGPIPDGYEVAHDCDNPPCFNPGHLHLATHKENHAESAQRKRRVGERHPQALLTWDAVRALRQMRADGASCYALAKQFGVSRQTVVAVCTGRTWREEGMVLTLGKLPPRGEACVKSRLTEEVVRSIRVLYVEEPKLSMADIGDRFGLSRGHVHAIIHRRVWKHVQ